MYKIITIDLDGTLLNPLGEISEENIIELKKCIEKGIEVVLASGRVVSSIKNFANEIGSNNYLISGNGSTVYDIKNEKVIYQNTIPKEKVLQLIKICEENSIYYSVYTEKGIVTKSLNYNILFYNNENKKMPDEKKTNIKIMENIYQYIENNPNVNVLKITICDENKIIFGGIIKKLRQIKDIDVLDVEHMSRKVITSGTEERTVEYHYTEITSKDVDKWNAIKMLANKLNIKQEEIMAIGDNMNDKQMIENSGLGVIMANCAPYMKNYADEIVSNNNEDGVAEAIEKFVLK